MCDARDNALVFERILPGVGGVAIAPVLICSDDHDLCCTVVVVEVASEPNVVLWTRTGLNKSEAGAVGERVEWFPNVPALWFRREDYVAMLWEFRLTLGHAP